MVDFITNAANSLVTTSSSSYDANNFGGYFSVNPRYITKYHPEGSEDPYQTLARIYIPRNLADRIVSNIAQPNIENSLTNSASINNLVPDIRDKLVSDPDTQGYPGFFDFFVSSFIFSAHL